MALDIKKFINRFLEEAKDHLSNLNTGLVELEQNFSVEQINSLFRAAHTLKGSSRMLKLEPITQIAHSLEDALSALREEKFALTSALLGLLYDGVDALSAQLELLADNPDLPELNPEQIKLCQKLSDWAVNPVAEEVATPAEQPDAELIIDTTSADQNKKTTANLANKNLKTSDTLRINLSKLEELIGLMGELVSNHTAMRSLATTAKQLEKQLYGQGALAIQMQRFAKDIRETVLDQESLMLELHDKTLQMRMLPLGIVLDPAASLVREMARSLNKQVDSRIYGSQIELDRQMIDKLADPIIHLLRNSLDHGLEPAAERLAKGKSARGLIQISAHQDAGWVVISISDDGRGLNLQAIGVKAVQKGLVSQAELDEMPSNEIADLIFQPGFSTSDIVTDISGRGVGMDVVKRTLVDELQGVINIETQEGKGTRFIMRLPLSLAKMRVLLVKAAAQEIGFTAQYIAELITVPKASLIDVANHKAVIVFNEFVPVVRLDDLINLPPKIKSSVNEKDNILLLIVRVHSEKLALVIDELVDERDLIIKQLPEHLLSYGLISGMVSNGKNNLVGLLHVPYLIEKARRLRLGIKDKNVAVAGKQHILVVDDSLNTREIERDILEAAGYQVTLAEDGQDGLIKAQANQFDAVLTDVEMPIMDGFTLTEKLRQLDAYKDKPIIIITSREKEEDKQRGIDVGASAYIVKGGFDQTNLVDTLKILLD